MRKPKAKIKLKTKSGAANRFKLTANGKVRRGSSGKRHILTKKSTGRKRGLRKPKLVSDADAANVREMIRG